MLIILKFNYTVSQKSHDKYLASFPSLNCCSHVACALYIVSDHLYIIIIALVMSLFMSVQSFLMPDPDQVVQSVM